MYHAVFDPLLGQLRTDNYGGIGTMFTQTANVTVANTVTESTLLSTGVGSLTFPPYFFTPGRTLRIYVVGYNSATANPEIDVKVKFGTTTLMSTGLVTSQNPSNGYFEVHGFITCYTNGASGTLWPQGFFVQAEVNAGRYSMASTAPVTIDMTASQTLDVTVTWGTASASNTITSTNAMVEVLN